MKDTATVNGVTLTRAQVEEAQRQLAEPGPKRGDYIRLRFSGKKGLVLSTLAANAVRREFEVRGWPKHAPEDGIIYVTLPSPKTGEQGGHVFFAAHSEYTKAE